jgi:hypothetical protein
MIAASWALVAALAAVSGTPPVAAPPIRLAPVRCPELPDATVRTPLRVELGRRLLDEGATDDPDFVLVSIACSGSDATVLAVHQGGGGPVRRLVPLGDVAVEARPRAVALAVVELVNIADARASSPPAAAAPSRPVAVATETSPPVRVSPIGVTFDGTVVLWGGYLSSSPWTVGGALVRLGLELGAQTPAPRSLKWGLAYELTGVGGSYETVIMNGLLALVQLRGGRFVPEVGVGGRLGVVSDFGMVAASSLKLAGGPLVSLAVNIPFTPAVHFALGVEGGYDFNSHGAWVIPRFGLGIRY